MKLTNSQKICLGILGISLVGLVVDRVTGSGSVVGPAQPSNVSNSASAAGAVQPVAEATVLKPQSAAVPIQGPASELSTLLQALNGDCGDERFVRDAFAIPVRFGMGAGDSSLVPNQRVASFAAAHRLKAIFNQPGREQILVDDRLIKVGQMLDGFRLESVGPLRAEFSDVEVHAELRMQVADGTETVEAEK